MQLHHKLLAVLAAALPVCCWAQSVVKVEGYVFSSQSTPLVGANVTVSGTGVGAATDPSGYYAIENLFAGQYEIVANYVGYHQGRVDVTVHKDLPTTANFRLRTKMLTLEELVVEAKRKTGPMSEFAEQITLLEIQQSNATSLDELLTDLPGVDVIDAGGSGKKRISIRGSNANQVLVVLDGIALNDPLVGDVDLNQIPISSIQEIKVLKGGNSSAYGSGAIGGVVEITSRIDAIDEVRMNASVGDFGSVGIRPSFSGNIGNVSYFFNGEYLNEDGDYPYSYSRSDAIKISESRMNAGFRSTNYFGKLVFELPNHTFQVQASGYRAKRGLPGLISALSPFASAVNDRSVLVGRHRFRTRNFTTTLQLSRHSSKTEFENAVPPDAPLRLATVSNYHTAYRVNSTEIRFETSRDIASIHSMTVNANITVDDFSDRDLSTADSGPTGKTDNVNLSLAVRNEWQLPKPPAIDELTLNHAVRLDRTTFDNQAGERADFTTSPRVGLAVRAHLGVLAGILKGNLGRSFRTPTFADLFFQDLRVKGNADLKAEKSWDFDSGIELSASRGGKWHLSATYFRQDIENLIVWQLGSFATWQPFNTDALTKGWEFGTSWQGFANRLHVSASHVILDALNKSGERNTHDKKLTYRPRHTTKAAVSFELSRFSMSYKRRIVSERYETFANTKALSAYAVDDFALSIKARTRSPDLVIKLSIFNLFDERYEIIERSPLPGRYWRLGGALVF